MAKKHGTTIGDINRNRIYDIIVDHHPNGIYQHEIIEKTGLVRQTVYTHLRDLKEENKVIERKRQYSILTNPGELLDFAMVINNAGIGLTGVPKHLINVTDWEDGITRAIPCVDYFKKPDRPYPSSKFSNEDLEKHLFDFARTIGAFIIYIFIEVMRPSENKNVNAATQNRLSRDFLDRAISIHGLFRHFQDLLIDSEFIYKKFGTKESVYELNKDQIDKLSTAFAKVFPAISQSLEKCWLDNINSEIEWSKRDGCNHEWEYFHVYKIGKYYKCHRCQQLARSTHVNNAT